MYLLVSSQPKTLFFSLHSFIFTTTTSTVDEGGMINNLKFIYIESDANELINLKVFKLLIFFQGSNSISLQTIISH